MDCQVCFKPYNTSSRQPKTLVCGHTYCTECLIKLQYTTSSSIMCPKDRKMSAVPEGGVREFMTNFAVLDMLGDDCSDCHEKTQDGPCLPEHCSKLLCSECKDSHLKDYRQELVTELEAMKTQMSKQQAICDDNSDLTKMMDQFSAAITEINRVFDAEKEKMITAIRGKQEADVNDYFEWKKNFNVCLAKGRSFLDKVMSEIMLGVDKLSDEYVLELKKQIISEKEAICEVKLGTSQFSLFDASGFQQEFDRFTPVMYDLVMSSHGTTNRTSGATAAETKENQKQTTPIPTAGLGRRGGKAITPVTGNITKAARETRLDEQQLMPVPDYTAVTVSQSYGKYGSGVREFCHPWGVAVSPVTGNIAISDHSNHRIHILTSDLCPIRIIGSQQFIHPAGVCFSSTGSLFIADKFNNRIQQMTEEGEHIRTFGSEGFGQDQFNHPEGICWERGLLYVCDNYKIKVMKESGEHVKFIGGIGSAPGQFSSRPQFIQASSQHDKLVVSDELGLLHFFSLNGQHRKTIRPGQLPYNMQRTSGIAIDSLGQVIVSDFKGRCVVVLGESGGISIIRLPAGENVGKPQGVTVTQDGTIIVCDFEQHKIYKFTTGHTLKDHRPHFKIT